MFDFLWSQDRRGNAPLAQLVEQLTLNQWVRGSSPRRCTITKTVPRRGMGLVIYIPSKNERSVKEFEHARILYAKTRSVWLGSEFPGGIYISGLTSRAMKSVTLTQRVHLFPFRTQKLSFAVPTILAWRRAGKIGQR